MTHTTFTVGSAFGIDTSNGNCSYDGSTITTNNGNTTVTFSWPSWTTFGLAKVGTGALLLTNGAYGPSIVDGGTLELAGNETFAVKTGHGSTALRL